eukprot:Gregarina_sp_Pseudo_9__5445@NODE_683_length_2372_cov_7_164595_g646_i0_p2_GENE_NODE_683_length_2372_cov_7_164595_g646_i0NODE_683_length_2372_cov_7_164595_g646_i0_p2_ORF_typecomplete_len152_score13_11DUF743/PF05332_11/0_2_NODE_683_length_2372_cov_7_164595_g646_i014741929
MPPIPLGLDKLVPVPLDWNLRHSVSMVERRSSAATDSDASLTHFLQEICNEQFESNLDYRVRGSSWRAGVARINGFQLTIKDVQKQARHVSLSIVIDLAAPETVIANKDLESGVFVISTLRGRLDLRDCRKFGTWIDIIERKQVVAKKLSS